MSVLGPLLFIIDINIFIAAFLGTYIIELADNTEVGQLKQSKNHVEVK